MNFYLSCINSFTYFTQVSSTATKGFQTNLLADYNLTSTGDDLQATKSLLNKVRSQMVQLKAERVIELAKLHAKVKIGTKYVVAPSAWKPNSGRLEGPLSAVYGTLLFTLLC